MNADLITAVRQSRIDHRLKLLALTLATYENGTGIYPGIRTLMRNLGQKESTIRNHLHALITLGILIPDGQVGHTRRFRFNLDQLKCYIPSEKRAKALNSQRVQPSEFSALSPPATLSIQNANPLNSQRQPSEFSAALVHVRTVPTCTEGSEVQEITAESEKAKVENRQVTEHNSSKVAPSTTPTTEPKPTTETPDTTSPKHQLEQLRQRLGIPPTPLNGQPRPTPT